MLKSKMRREFLRRLRQTNKLIEEYKADENNEEIRARLEEHLALDNVILRRYLDYED